MESLAVCSCAADITCGNVVLPYIEGSRVPRRLRLGPLIRRMDIAIVKVSVSCVLIKESVVACVG
jgi:hypothetical protein